MPGPGLVILMLAPIAAAGVLAVALRARLAGASRLGALWLLVPIVVATPVAARLRAAGVVPDGVLNRTFAVLVLLAAAGFLIANRGQRSALVRAGVRLTAAGAAANAAATLLYGAMPVLAASARWMGSDLRAGEHPDAEYVAVSASQVPALLLGDVLPVPVLESVVSLGDLLLVPGGAILLAAVLAPLLRPLPAPTPHREEVNP
ncbi:DUF5317 family protein [Nocardioides pantholopis]|uniref:DUF5317 family protein n=1 Tax=Nocardioides pantholopis TaxID=2483798 RepID=UPI000FD7D039|nr:DUF5317 family protein [Nocardioides pantholopis]